MEATLIDCPGCKQCEGQAGYILKKGAWRTTRSFEYIYMFVKGQGYFADGDSVAQKIALSTVARVSLAASRAPAGKVACSVSQKHDGYKRSGEARVSVDKFQDPRDHLVVSPRGETRNRRSVWDDITPEPFSGAHYATFPTDLPRICIQASTSEAGCCPECGACWARVVTADVHKENCPSTRLADGSSDGRWSGQARTYNIIGWRPTCSHNGSDPVPCLVLDPFGGTMTTLVAAQRLGRRSVGVDLSVEYLALAVRRLEKEPLPMALYKE